MVHIPEDAIITLGKRGDDLNELIVTFEDHFAKPEESSVARPSSSSPPSGPDHGWTDVEKPLPSNPEMPSPVSSPDHAPPNPSTMPDADHELVGAHEPPNPGASTESDQEPTAVHALLSSPVFPAWFLTDHGYKGPHAPTPDSWFDSDHRLVVEEPPSRPASPTESGVYYEHPPPPPSPRSASPMESDHEMVDVPHQAQFRREITTVG
jgi:hypothetical protein